MHQLSRYLTHEKYHFHKSSPSWIIFMAGVRDDHSHENHALTRFATKFSWQHVLVFHESYRHERYFVRVSYFMRVAVMKRISWEFQKLKQNIAFHERTPWKQDWTIMEICLRESQNRHDNLLRPPYFVSIKPPWKLTNKNFWIQIPNAHICMVQMSIQRIQLDSNTFIYAISSNPNIFQLHPSVNCITLKGMPHSPSHPT